MFLYHDMTRIPGDKIKRAVLRSDLAPISETLEIELRLDDGNRDLLKEGLDIYAGEDRAYRVVLAQMTRRNAEQSLRLLESMHLTCVLREVHPLSFVRERAVYLRNTSLTEIYRACGAQLAKPIKNDIPIPVFTCLIGDTPTFGIAKLFQEHAGVLRVNADREIEFLRLEDIFTQTPVVTVPANVTEEIESGFILRHEIPWFFSINPRNDFIFGDNSKPRHARFLPLSTETVLRNMTRVLVQAKRLRIDLAMSVCAGDAAKVIGVDTYAILTAAHVYSSGTDGLEIEQYTRAWIGSLSQ